jgi:hypothetical protein
MGRRQGCYCNWLSFLTGLIFNIQMPVIQPAFSFNGIAVSFCNNCRMKKYLFTIVIIFFSLFAMGQSTEEDAIKKLLEKEAATWRSNDIKAHADCWHIQPYSKVLVSLPNGKSFDIDPKNVIDPPGGKLGNGGSAAMSNFKFALYGNNAWVSHDEISTATDGSKTYSREIRMVEKINGEWKLVGQVIQLYIPE